MLRNRGSVERFDTQAQVVEIGAAGVVVACAPGALELERVKPEGKAEMDAAAWARGARIELGERLTTEKEAHA